MPLLHLTSQRVLLPSGFAHATVSIEGPRIVAVTLDGLPVMSPDDVHLDVGDKVVAPAWVNAHTHLPMSSLRALGGTAARQGNVVEELWFAIEARISADDIRSFTRMGALECLVSGTGAVFEHYYAGDAVAAAFADTGLSGIVAPTLQDLGGPGVGQREAQLEATARIHADASLADRGIVAALGPHATDTVSDAFWARLLTLPDDLPIHVHVAQSPEEVARAAARGGTPVELLHRVGALERRVLAVHALYVTDADRKLLDPNKHLLGHCPWSQTQFAFPAPIQQWIDQGFRVAVGTDAGACNDSMNVQQELRLMSCGALYAVTEEARTYAGDTEGLAASRARAYRASESLADPEWLWSTVGSTPGSLHPKLPLGRIAPGAWANVAVWDLDHPALWPATDPMRALVFADASPALHTMIVSGRVIGDVGDPRALLRSDDVREMVKEATARLAALVAQL